MKKLLIIGLLLMVLLTGCGTFNGFVMPDDSEFIAIVESLTTPKEICQYMKDNFTYETVPGLSTPYELFLMKVGNCNDFAYFGRYIAHQHGYETYWVRIFFTIGITTHVMGIYVEDGKYNYSSNTNYYPIQADSFEDCVLDYFPCPSGKELLKYDVYDYKEGD